MYGSENGEHRERALIFSWGKFAEEILEKWHFLLKQVVFCHGVVQCCSQRKGDAVGAQFTEAHELSLMIEEKTRRGKGKQTKFQPCRYHLQKKFK